MAKSKRRVRIYLGDQSYLRMLSMSSSCAKMKMRKERKEPRTCHSPITRTYITTGTCMHEHPSVLPEPARLRGLEQARCSVHGHLTAVFEQRTPKLRDHRYFLFSQNGDICVLQCRTLANGPRARHGPYRLSARRNYIGRFYSAALHA